MASSSSEAARVEASRAACEEGALSEAPTWEKMLEAPVPMRATGANVSLCTSGGRANEARPQFVGAHGRAALTLGSLGNTGFSPSQVAVVGDAPFVPGSSNIMDLGNGELGLPGGIPPAGSSTCRLGASGGGHGVGMLIGHDSAPTAAGDADLGWSGCSATSLGQS
jgi:hypothetical protein